MLTLHLGAFLGSTHITNTVQKFKNILRTLWGWFVTKHPLNKNPVSLTSEIMCSYMRVSTVLWTELRIISYPDALRGPLTNAQSTDIFCSRRSDPFSASIAASASLNVSYSTSA